ncbi:restriction endonuclease subunit S [Cronobacter sakazakii]|uniref:restriction endonuclease subunit S n=1 Tax=Cronobacter sakazakii TaxID=28141 RepID=UPI000B4B3DB1|nr:restriction endonuclease subunit S [Cronobacter sakazakii]EKA9348607.1 restriction endonuclease subunit S [Cronobacter sakazakii]EKK4041257.1 restriction endonuclease subunit S [Cronobacter sakazakii]ELL7785081.1 restriction endonuclease subunit S [Cronobacter sakazakii]ELY2559161.1 restriction endonuclease subunit S [Cronobacter sakazakii]ELY2753125.1 restriction endonuclease subunit S [Cronobacter sakazakii]
MAKYKAYPEYKDSGVEWLGEIPGHWKTLAIKHVAQLNPSKSCISLEKMKGMCSFVPMEKLKFNSLSLDEVKDVSDVYNGYTYFENEDILIAKVTPCFENKNMVVAHDLHNGIGFGSSEIYILRCNDIINNDFLFYRLQEDNFMSIAEGAMTGAGGLKRVPSELLNNFKFGLPGKKEQSIIVNFLKHETAKIDNLIEKQQQLIELLKEKRQAVISHAVTKGLNSDVPMKNSGVEWLGDVPEHWRVSRIKNYAKIESGHTPSRTKPEYWVSCNIPWVSLNDSKQLKEVDYIEDTFYKISELGMANSSAHLLPARAVVFTRDASIGLSAITTKSMAVSQHLIAWICDEKFVIPEFLLLVFYAMEKEFERYTFGATIKTIGMDNVRGLKSTFPPVEEQRNLIDWAFNKIEKIKSSISRVEDMLSLLQERRTALISAAVTGKIDVRDWVAPEAQDVEESQEATA